MGLTRGDIINQLKKKDNKGKEKKKAVKFKDLETFLSENALSKEVLKDLESYPDYYASKS